MKNLIACCLLLVSFTCLAGETEYRPGGQKFDRVWQAFYVDADHEPEIAVPLVKAGRPMTLHICAAVTHPDMKRRRYAIDALGLIGDKRALPVLETILKNRDEIDYFRGDALEAIYRLDRKLAVQYAGQYRHDNDYLNMIADEVTRHPGRLSK